MVTTNEQDGASSSSPPNPSQLEQQPEANSNHMNHNHPDESDDSGNEAAGPLRHPAPPPDEPPAPYSEENWKRPPPRLMIKIYQVPVGVVVSWHALLTPNHEEIAKYQLYSYQEGRRPASTSLWKKLGDMEPMPLPMACTLSQFSGGRTYHFAMRAVDIHGRCGRFSEALSMYMDEDKVADELKVKKEETAKAGDEAHTSKTNANSEEMESVQGKERESLVTEEMDTDENSAGQPRDPVETPAKEEEKLAECDKELEKAAGQAKEQDMEVEQGKEQDREKVQAKEQDIEMVQVKEEKDP